MPESKPHVARLGRGDLLRVRALEADLRGWLVAFDAALPFADLTEEQLGQLKELEKEWKVTLVGYGRPGGAPLPGVGPKEISAPMLERIEQLEAELCVNLVLYASAQS